MAKLKIPTELRTKEEMEQKVDKKLLIDFLGSSKDSQASAPKTPATSTMTNQKNPKTFPLLLSAEMHQEMTIAARKAGMSLKEFIISAVYEKIERNR